MSVSRTGDSSTSGTVETLSDLERYRRDFTHFQATLRMEINTDDSGAVEAVNGNTKLKVPGLERGQVAELVAIRPERFDVTNKDFGVFDVPQRFSMEGSMTWPQTTGTATTTDYPVDFSTDEAGAEAESGTLGRVGDNLDEVWRGHTVYGRPFYDAANGLGGGGFANGPGNLGFINYRDAFGRGPITYGESDEQLALFTNARFNDEESMSYQTNLSIQVVCDIWELDDPAYQDIRQSA